MRTEKKKKLSEQLKMLKVYKRLYPGSPWWSTMTRLRDILDLREILTIELDCAAHRIRCSKKTDPRVFVINFLEYRLMLVVIEIDIIGKCHLK